MWDEGGRTLPKSLKHVEGPLIVCIELVPGEGAKGESKPGVTEELKAMVALNANARISRQCMSWHLSTRSAAVLGLMRNCNKG